MNKPVPEHCFECGVEEYSSHRMDCESKRVFDAYLVLRDTNKYPYFTDKMLEQLQWKAWVESMDRKYADVFTEEGE